MKKYLQYNDNGEPVGEVVSYPPRLPACELQLEVEKDAPPVEDKKLDVRTGKLVARTGTRPSTPTPSPVPGPVT